MTAPKTPDGLPTYDPNKDYSAGTSAASGTTAKTDIWNIPGDLNGKQIYTSYGNKVAPGLARHLDPSDVTQAQSPTIEQIGVQKDPNDPNGPGIPTGPYALPISMYSKDPAGYLALQRELFQAGYFGSKAESSMRWGGDTSSTMDAWTALLRDTVQQQSLGRNVTWQDVLGGTLKSTKAGAGNAAQKANVIALSDPAQISASVQSAAQAVLGRNLSDQEVQHFVSEFQAAQTKFSQQSNAVDAANASGAGGNFTLTQPDLTGDAQKFVQQGHGTEAAGNNLSDYVSALEQMIGSG